MSSGFRTIITFIFFICGIAVIVLTLILIVKEKRRAHVIQNEIYTLEQEKKYYEHENMEWQDKIAYLKSEHSYEKEAKKLNYKKQGEHVVIVRRSPQNKQDANSIVLGQKKNQLKHYQIWLNYFFNNKDI